MPRFSRRVMAVTAAASCVALVVLVPSACASPTPAPTSPQNVITIPSLDQIANAPETGRCPRLMTHASALTGGLSGFPGPDGHPLAPSVASAIVLLLAIPLTATECTAAGN